MQAVTMPYGKTSSRIVETKFVPKKYEMQVVTIPQERVQPHRGNKVCFLRSMRCRL